MYAGAHIESTPLAIALIVTAFTGCYILTAKYVPCLRKTKSGKIGNVLVRSLVGSAAVFAVLALYDLGAVLQLYGTVSQAQEFGYSNGAAIANTVVQITWHSGLLLAAAAVVWYLGPLDEED